jgi:hypothetical protein
VTFVDGSDWGCRRADSLCNEAQELIGRECEHTKHAMTHHFRGPTDADMATAELVLEAPIDRSLAVRSL